MEPFDVLLFFHFKTVPSYYFSENYFYLSLCSLFPVQKLTWALISHHVSTQSDFLLFSFCRLVFKPFKLHHHGLIKRLVYWTEFGERLWKSKTGFQPVTHQLCARFITDKNIIKQEILSFGADLITDSCWMSASVSSSMFHGSEPVWEWEQGGVVNRGSRTAAASACFIHSDDLLIVTLCSEFSQAVIRCEYVDVMDRTCETELHLNQIVSHVRVWCLVCSTWQ